MPRLRRLSRLGKAVAATHAKAACVASVGRESPSAAGPVVVVMVVIVPVVAAMVVIVPVIVASMVIVAVVAVSMLMVMVESR